MQLLLSLGSALCFTLGGVCMKLADGLRNPWAVAGFLTLFGVGALAQSLAMRSGELGSTYILILGLEATLAFALGIMLFGESTHWVKVLAVLLILIGVILLDRPQPLT
jgi:multidrug transporter EmrE-like cation transporter